MLLEMLEAYRTSSPSANWRPSPVAALSTSPDGAKVAVARDDCSLEIWLVSPGSVGWHCQMVIVAIALLQHITSLTVDKGIFLLLISESFILCL